MVGNFVLRQKNQTLLCVTWPLCIWLQGETFWITIESLCYIIKLPMNLTYKIWCPCHSTHNCNMLIRDFIDNFFRQFNFSQLNYSTFVRVTELLQANPAEFIVAQDACHVITTQALLHGVVTGGTMLHLNTSNQATCFLGCHHPSIRFIFLPEDLCLLTCGGPVCIFLALEAPHGTTYAYYWLDTGIILSIKSCRGDLCWCCLDNQLALVGRASLPFWIHFQECIKPLCQVSSIQWRNKWHQGDIIDCWAALIARAPQNCEATFNLGPQVSPPAITTELVTTSRQGHIGLDNITIWNTILITYCLLAINAFNLEYPH